MPQIQTATVVLTFNKLVKSGAIAQDIVSDETLKALEQVAQELAGDGVIVECEIA